jgi:hypothetical protein
LSTCRGDWVIPGLLFLKTPGQPADRVAFYHAIKLLHSDTAPEVEFPAQSDKVKYYGKDIKLNYRKLFHSGGNS